jgi:putative zinc finger/helix-turn-helix YgiT family protein
LCLETNKLRARLRTPSALSFPSSSVVMQERDRQSMICDVCRKGEIRTSIQQTYRYKECGLDNVYLLNMEFRVCDACGTNVPRLKRMPEIHATIARAIAMQPSPLRGQDVRFLRKQLGYSAKDWATFLRTDASTLSRWENNQQEWVRSLIR